MMLTYIKIGSIILALTVIGWLYYSWKSSIEEQAILQFKNAQQEQIIKDHEKELEFLKLTDEINRAIQISKQKKIDDLEKFIDEEMNTVQNNNKDQKSSKILSDTISSIQKLRKK